MVIEDASKRQRILESVHNTSHLGINHTLDMVSSQYYWPGATNDVRAYVSFIIVKNLIYDGPATHTMTVQLCVWL